MKANYDFFLFVKLYEEYVDDQRENPYDEQFDYLSTLYSVYAESKYNRVDKGGYECIEDFLRSEFPTKFEK